MSGSAAGPTPRDEHQAQHRYELVRDGSATTLVVDGHPQSHVNAGDPGDLGFEYLEQLALVLDTLTPAPPARLPVTHIGGAGLSLARYLAASRPGSPQLVFEPDQALTDLVRRELPLPRGHRIRVRAQDGRTGLAALGEASAQVVILDAYEQGRVPAELTTTEAFGQLRRVLATGGVLLANLADEPGLRYVARVAATATGWFPHLALVGVHEVLKGRRFGNVVLIAGTTPLPQQSIATALARRAIGAGLRDADSTGRWARSARPLTDADPQRSPPAPEPGRWRVR